MISARLQSEPRQLDVSSGQMDREREEGGATVFWRCREHMRARYRNLIRRRGRAGLMNRRGSCAANAIASAMIDRPGDRPVCARHFWLAPRRREVTLGNLAARGAIEGCD